METPITMPPTESHQDRLERAVETLADKVGVMAVEIASLKATLQTRNEQEPAEVIELRTKNEALEKKVDQLDGDVIVFKSLVDEIKGGYKLLGWLATVGPFVGGLLAWLATRH